MKSRIPSHSRRRGRTAERGTALQVILGIIAGVVVLVMLVVAVTVWAVRNFVDIEISETADGTRVEVTTPFGEMTVSDAEVEAEDLGLPLYPGAELEDGGGTFSLRGGTGDDVEGLTVRGAEYRVRATLEEVDEWYRNELGSEFKRHEGEEIDLFDGKNWPGKIEFDMDDLVYLEESGSRVLGVALEEHGRRVDIGLFELRKDEPL